jgi:hypothetical protein
MHRKSLEGVLVREGEVGVRRRLRRRESRAAPPSRSPGYGVKRGLLIRQETIEIKCRVPVRGLIQAVDP